MRTPPSLADFTHARACKPFCEKSLTLPTILIGKMIRIFRKSFEDWLKIEEAEEKNE